MRMGIAWVVQLAILLSLPIGSLAAEVEYQHPDLTVVAKEEPLQSVLKSVGKKMQIFVTTPTSLNPMISCDIQNEPIKQAFKNLLGDLSYSLEWDDKSGRLLGLTLLASDGGAAATTANSNSTVPDANQSATVAVTNQGAEVPVSPNGHVTPMADSEATMAEHEAQMDTEREEREARMAEEREAHEAEMTVRRQEEEIAHEARMQEDVGRKKAEEAVLFAEEAARRP
jgi:hypothetical protein